VEQAESKMPIEAGGDTLRILPLTEQQASSGPTTILRAS